MFGFFKKTKVDAEFERSGEEVVTEPVKRTTRRYRENPHATYKRNFFGGDTDRLLSGWTTDVSHIDYYLATQLRLLSARSRELIRLNPYGKKYVLSMKSNIVGPVGVTINAQSKWLKNGVMELDATVNALLEAAFKDWGKKDNCDYTGNHSWLSMQNLAVTTASHDGEFLFRVYEGKKYGKYGFQLKPMDPSELDITVNRKTKTGEIRLGVEYDSEGRRVRYHFRKNPTFWSTNEGGERYSLPASAVIHGFIREWVNQSRGIPWTHASLVRAKMLDKYDEAAMVASRYGASKQLFLADGDGDPDAEYEGEDQDDDGESGETGYNKKSLSEVDPGSIEYIGNKKIEKFDPAYPHEMYDPFTKRTLRGISAGFGLNYHTLSNDLENVNYSSIRAGFVDDRELFKLLQNWFIEELPMVVYERFVRAAYMTGALKLPNGTTLKRPLEDYLSATYQGRRWQWVDPLKDGQANQLAINNRSRSLSSIIREQGNEPVDVFEEIRKEREIMQEMGILPVDTKVLEVANDGEEDDDTKTKK